MDIMALLSSDGYQLKRLASTRGGEYAGPCPFCGEGKDRFRVWPQQGEGGRWWCRQCGKSGDVIQYLREIRGLSFKEACDVVGKEMSISSFHQQAPRESWQPRQTAPPGDRWQRRAQRLVREGEKCLYHSHSLSEKLLNWLGETRGLTAETIRTHRLGFQPADAWERPEHWGLEPVLKDNGTAKKLWLPRGLVIPYCQAGAILRIRFRRFGADGDPRYYLLKGSNTRAMIWNPTQPVMVVVESELDGMLLFQEAGDAAGVVALGNAQARPDSSAYPILNQSRLILVALDSDGAGAREAWRWWMKHFPQARRWPPIDGKDIAEMWQAGINLKEWVTIGVEEYV
ncbi:MAG: primase-helicase zinc-binding domain-containing protein [Candidatus Methanomethylicaceae archaeon]